MLQDFTITPSTIIIAAVVILLVVLAVRRLTKRGMCDCHDDCEGCSSKPAGASSKDGCPHCGAAEAMVSNMESALDDPKGKA